LKMQLLLVLSLTYHQIMPLLESLQHSFTV
jgi:hypothetical protein